MSKTLQSLRWKLNWALASLLLLLASCGEPAGGINEIDTPQKGTIRISVDESFKPVIDSQIKVYMASHPETQIIADYKPEAACLNDLQNDSIRLVIVTRGLNDAEADQLQAKLSYRPTWGRIAWDAVALILHKSAKDSVFTTEELAALLSGANQSREIVMDGNSATSTVRFAIDSVLQGKPLGKNVVAAKSSEGVLDYVAENPTAIGMIGVSWIGNRDDAQQLSFLDKIKVGSVRCDECVGQPYTMPYQANMALGRYPLMRGIFYILKESYTGLGRGFANFLTYERGQLIFKSAYLLPGKMSFEVRDIEMNEN